jgi:hypothetical protein
LTEKENYRRAVTKSPLTASSLKDLLPVVLSLSEICALSSPQQPAVRRDTARQHQEDCQLNEVLLVAGSQDGST